MVSKPWTGERYGRLRSLLLLELPEDEAGIVAAERFAAVSKTFATNMSERISEMMQSVTTPVDIQLKLLNILQHMHHDTQTAAAVSGGCGGVEVSQ